MKLRPNQVKEHFARGPLLPLYLLSGDEPLLMQEAADQIRAEARKAGFTERERFTVENHFDWSNVLQAGNSLSLFGDRKLLEVRNDKGKFDDAAKKALQEYCAHPNPDALLLLTLPKVDQKTQGTKWFQQLESAGVFIQVWPVKPDALPQWIHQRLQAVHLEPTREAVQLLAERVEGNLLAADQEVKKLALLRGEGPIDVGDIEDAVADHARYDLYDLMDQALQGNAAHAIKMLNYLRSSGMEPPVLLWAVTRELRTLARMAALIANGQAPAQALAQHKVWDNRKSLVQNALQRLSLRLIQRCLLEAARIDQCHKGLGSGDPWDGFTNILLWLSGRLKPGLLALDG